MNDKTSRKTVIFLSDVDYFKGGAEKSLFDAMATPALNPILAVPAKGPLSNHADEHNIPVIEIEYGNVLTVHRPFKFMDVPRAFIAAWRAARQLKAAAKQNGAAAIHTNGLKAHGIACLSRILGGAKPVLHYRSIPHTGKEKLFWRIAQIIAAKQILVSRPCWPAKNLPANTHVIFNGIKPMDRSILPKRPKSRKPLTLGFVGRIHPSKGIHDLIGWFGYAHNKGLDIRLSLRGEAAPEDKEYEDMVLEMVKEKGLTDLITFEGSKTGYENIYADMDVNIVSSVTPDPLPRSVMEASALGIPVLGYPAGGIPDMIDDGENGFLIQNGIELHDALKRLTEEKGLYEKISEAAIQNAQNKFTLEALHASLTKLYEDI